MKCRPTELSRKLDQQGVLKKTYGGAVRKENGLSVEFIPGEYFLNSDKKYRIAKRAYEYMKGGDSIIIDDSTTGYYLAKYIKEHAEKHLAVVMWIFLLWEAMLLAIRRLPWII